MGAGGVFAAPSTPREPNVGFEIMDSVAVGDFLRGRLYVRKKNRHAGCGHAGVRHADKLRENLWCNGDRPPGHAAYAPLAYWRNSKKLPSPPFEAVRPLRGCGYFLETLRSGASVRLRRTHPCAYGSCCFRFRYYERRKRSLIFCMRTKSGLPLDKNGFIVILNTEVA